MDPDLLRTSFAVVERRAEFAVKYFYAHLFHHHPDLRALFPVDFPEDMRRQRDRLFAALTRVVARLDDPELPEYLRALGRDHRKYLARPEHYAAVGESLLAAFATVSGAAWTRETEKAWQEAYAGIADHMLQGAREARGAGRPPWWDAEVVRHVRHGDDLALLTLRPSHPLPYLPGQYVTVNTPRLPGIWRPYSLANAPRPDHTVDLHVSLVPGGLLSTVLVNGVREGDVLRIGAAGGDTVLRGTWPRLSGAPGTSGTSEAPCAPERRPITLIAAGTGWAPVKALLEQMTGEALPGGDLPGGDRSGGDLPGAGRSALGLPGEDRSGEEAAGEEAAGEDSPDEAPAGGQSPEASTERRPAEGGERTRLPARPRGSAGTGGRKKPLADPSAPSVRLFVVARDSARLYDRLALEAAQARLPGLTVTCITPAPGRPGAQATERLLTALGNRAGWDRHDVYLAGPPGLVDEVTAHLPLLGTRPDRIFHDSLPPAGEDTARPLGPGEWLLGRPQPHWHDPAARDLPD
ncbi:globin domain-containing protein [Streptomyces sp. NPDC001595]|uniref:globin domain-containing protein n=1 Tax=Streptomyces sp. NPDC001532 TaxID=3154520 RepID=UPI003327657F